MQFASETGFKTPAITVIIPVYKEHLTLHLAPAIRSLLGAIRRYEIAGGEANVIIGDDAMQLTSDIDATARMQFYHNMGVSWVARPRHQPILQHPTYVPESSKQVQIGTTSVS